MFLIKLSYTLKVVRNVKHQTDDQNGWILDSGASQHFMSTKNVFIDFEVVTGALKVKTVAAKAILCVEGKVTILLSHFVENLGVHTKTPTCIYPVLYIPRLSVKLLSMGVFLLNKQEVHRNAMHLTFHNAKTQKPLLSAYPQTLCDTIFWIDQLQINTVSIAMI